MSSMVPYVQCIRKDGDNMSAYLSKGVSFIILLLQLGLVGFSGVIAGVMIRVMFSFSDRVGLGLPDME